MRPSVSSTLSRSPVTSTRAIRASVSSLEVLAPRADEGFCMLLHQTFQHVQLAYREATVPFQAHGLEPEFSLPLVAAHVDVHGLGTVAGVEEEPVRADAQGGGHGREILHPMRRGHGWSGQQASSAALRRRPAQTQRGGSAPRRRGSGSCIRTAGALHWRTALEPNARTTRIASFLVIVCLLLAACTGERESAAFGNAAADAGT